MYQLFPMGVIQNVINKISASMKHKSGKQNLSHGVVGIDIGSSSIKVVQLKKSGGRISLETYGAIALGPYVQKQIGELVELNPDVIVPALLDVLKESNVNAGAGAVSIRGSASLIFTLSVPSSNAKDLSSIVITEARKYIPVPVTEVSLDWWPIPTPPTTKHQLDEIPRSEVLVAALRNEKLEAYRSIMSKSPIPPLFYEIETFSIMRATFDNELSSVIVVDFGASGTRIAIVHYGVIKRFHIIKRGSYQLTEMVAQTTGNDFIQAEALKKEIGLEGKPDTPAARVTEVLEEGLRYVFSEIKGVILRYEKDYHRAVSKMIVTGGGARTPGLGNYLASEFGGEIEFADPFDRTHAPELLADVLRVAGPEFSVAVGLALKNLQK